MGTRSAGAGKSECTLVVKICSQSDGPWSPSWQKRFKTPEGAKFADQERVLAAYRRRHGTE